MKKFALSFLIGALITSSVVCYSEELSREVSENIVRLHVVADSNEACAQEVKLKVRDRVLSEMQGINIYGDVENSLGQIEKAANEVLESEGFAYRATVQMGVFDFPTKYYDGFALPKGKYEAVRIILGEGKGENWWCVLFPPLCMVDAATEEQEALLAETFGENYDMVTDEGKGRFNIKFRLAEIF